MNTPLEPTLPSPLSLATEALIENLLAAEPLVAYHRAQILFQVDAPARALIDRLSAAQADVRQKQSRREVTQSDIDQLRILQGEAQANRVIFDYVQTQQAAIGFLREINREISELLGVDFASLAKQPGCC